MIIPAQGYSIWSRHQISMHNVSDSENICIFKADPQFLKQINILLSQ